MHQALRIHELLELIFDHSDTSTRKRCTVVCKDWSEPALDSVWMDVADLKALLRGLGTLKWYNSGSSNKLRFDPRPTHKDWLRFERKYCSRVHTLSICDNISFSEVLSFLGSIRPSHPIFPRLHTLRWTILGGYGLSECVIMFMHEGIGSFTLHALGNYHSENLSVLEAIPHRMPLLTDLTFNISPNIEYIQPLLALTLQLTCLKSLALPPFPNYTSILPSLSGIRGLTSLHVMSAPHVKPVSQYEPIERADYFSALTTIHIFCNYEVATKIFRGQIPHLSDVEVITPEYEKPSRIQSLLVDVARACPSIARVSLTLKRGASFSSSSQNDNLNTEHIRPILTRKGITSFVLMHPNPMNLTLADVEEIASSWPNIRHINLCSDPRLPCASNGIIECLTPRALLSFARYCPYIVTLGLFLEANFSSLPSNEEVDALSSGFKKLRVLSVGVSSIEDERLFASFLCHVLPQGCIVKYGSGWYDADAGSVNAKRWQLVNELLPILLSVRIRTIQRVERSLTVKKE